MVYYGNGNSGGATPVDYNWYFDGDKVTVLSQGSLVKTGYTFLGWSENPATTAATFTVGSIFTIYDDVALYAVWEEATYTVTYASGTHGAFTAVSTSGLHFGDQTPTAPVVVGEAGWQFTGWVPTPTLTVTGSITYVAQWTQEPIVPSPTLPPTSPSPSPTLPPTSPSPSPTLPPTTTTPSSTVVPTPTHVAPSPPPVIDEGRWALVNLILSVIGVILAVIVTIRALLLKKKEDEKVDEDENKQRNTQNQQQYNAKQNNPEKRKKYTQRRTIWLIAAVVLGIVGVVVFLLTEDWHLPRAWVDRWTIVNAIILIAEIVTIIFVFKHKKVKKYHENRDQNNSSTSTLQ